MFMANLLTSMGTPCTHEAIFTPKGLDHAKKVLAGGEPAISSRISRGENLSDYEMDTEAESSYMAAPFLKDLNAKVIHVVRNPIKVIGSLIGHGFSQFLNDVPTHFGDNPCHFDYEKFIYDNLPELSQEKSQLDRACLFYIKWNEMIENSGRVVLFHRIEDGPEKVKDFFGFRGEAYDNNECNSAANLSREWILTEITNPDIKKRLKEMSIRYGYSKITKIMIL